MKNVILKSPWQYGVAYENNAPNYYLVATRLFRGEFIARTDTEEKAKLIAALPNLVEALQLAEVTIKRLAKTDSANGTLDVIRAALAKSGVQS